MGALVLITPIAFAVYRGGVSLSQTTKSTSASIEADADINAAALGATRAMSRELSIFNILEKTAVAKPDGESDEEYDDSNLLHGNNIEASDEYQSSQSFSSSSSSDSVFNSLRSPINSSGRAITKEKTSLTVNHVRTDDKTKEDPSEKYLILDDLLNAEMGIAGVSSKPQVYLQTIKSGPHGFLLLCIFIVLVISVTLSCYQKELKFTEIRLDASQKCEQVVDDSFTCVSTDSSSTFVTWYANLNVAEKLPKYTNYLQLLLDLPTEVVDDLVTSNNTVANYSISISNGNNDAIVEDFKGRLVISCNRINDGLCEANNDITVVSARLRQNVASYAYVHDTQVLRLAGAIQFSAEVVDLDMLQKFAYRVRAVEEAYAPYQVYFYLVLSLTNMIAFAYFTYRIYQIPGITSFSDHMLERKLLVVVLLALFLQNNIVDWLVTNVTSVNSSYVKSRQVRDTICFALFFAFIFTVMGSYRFKIQRRKVNDTTRIRFVIANSLLTVVFIAARIVIIFTTRVQVAVILDIVLIFIGSSILLSIELYVSHVLSKKVYAATRQWQICFRNLNLVAYTMLGILLINAFRSNSTERTSRFAPTEETLTYLASVFAVSSCTYIASVMFLPPDQFSNKECKSRGYIIREKRQFVTTPTSLKGENSKPWDLLRDTVIPGVKPHWTPHDAFCIETLARMYNMSRMAYFDPPNSSSSGNGTPQLGCVNSKMLRKSKLKIVKHIHDVTTDTHALVLYGQHRVIVAFRGTLSRTNIKTDLDMRMMVPTTELTDSWKSHSVESEKLYVHRGFHKAYCSIKKQLLDTLQTIFSKLRSDDAIQLFCTGHSLGGALAILAALDIKLSLSRNVIMYNYGCPFVGCYSFSKFYDRHVPQSFMIVNEGDVIVDQPRRLIPFIRYFRPTYTNVGTSVLLDGRLNGNLLINPTTAELNWILRLQFRPLRHLTLSYKTNLDLIIQRILKDGERLIAHSEQQQRRDIEQGTCHHHTTFGAETVDSPSQSYFNRRRGQDYWTEAIVRTNNGVKKSGK